jgi:phosphatidylglycerophosphatase A
MHELLLTFFYFGKSKKAPGTVGSLAALIFWFFLAQFFFNHEVTIAAQNIFWGIFLTASFIYGCIASPIYARKFRKLDHGSIVLDEVVGQILALQITFLLLRENYFSQPKIIWLHLFFCFALFRFLDIKKPSFIGFCDRKLKNGFGVMFDDLLCGIIVALLGCTLIMFL